MPGAWRAGRCVGALRRACATAKHGGDARVQGIIYLLWTDPVNMSIDPPCRDDTTFAGNGFGAWADDDIDAGLDIGIAGLADSMDLPPLSPISALIIPQWSTISALVITVSTAPSARRT